MTYIWNKRENSRESPVYQWTWCKTIHSVLVYLTDSGAQSKNAAFAPSLSLSFFLSLSLSLTLSLSNSSISLSLSLSHTRQHCFVRLPSWPHVLTYCMTDPFHIIFNDFSIWLLVYTIEFNISKSFVEEV